MRLSILYRGPLSSCNYGCAYCPFAKRRETPAQMADDRAALERFVDWVREDVGDQLSILLTPWGEALTRSWYRDALVELSHLPHVARAAIQTNLSADLRFLGDADRDTLALWCTYHPTQTTRDRFLARIRILEAWGVRHSVGIVGFPEHLEEAMALREQLPLSTYLWVNAASGHGYSEGEIRSWERVDPHFRTSEATHFSRGHRCRTGEDVISVRGDGTVTRCHFVPEVIGDLYDGSFRAALGPQPCPKRVCSCHIGYAHLDRLKLGEVFGEGILERIPASVTDERR